MPQGSDITAQIEVHRSDIPDGDLLVNLDGNVHTQRKSTRSSSRQYRRRAISVQAIVTPSVVANRQNDNQLKSLKLFSPFRFSDKVGPPCLHGPNLCRL